MNKNSSKRKVGNIYRTTQISENLERLIKMTKEFCLSKQHIKYERYKIRKSGVIPPNELLPNGKTAELKKKMNFAFFNKSASFIEIFY